MERTGQTVVIVAKLTHEGKEYSGKRKVTLYSVQDCGDAVTHANVGLTLAEQSSIRTALKAKYGLGKVTTGGVQVNLADVDEV